MGVSLQPAERRRLRAELLRHRAGFDLTDAAYVQDVLKISLNTYKKCIAPEDAGSLVLSRHTYQNLARHAGFRPDEHGIAAQPSTCDQSLGAYNCDDYAFMCQRYVMYRRSFLHARNLNRSVLDISIDGSRRCLRFRETEDYVSDLGLPHDQEHVGDVHVDRDRSLLSLLGNTAGRVRLMLLVIPQRVIGREGLRMRGALLTHGRPRGYWQPTVTSLYVEEPPDPKAPIGGLCGTFKPDWGDYERISGEIRSVEEYVTIDTALVWRSTEHRPGRQA